MKRVAIVGAGITGLATAVHLQDAAERVEGGLEVVVLEARDRPGGNVRTERVDGYTIENGPNGFLDNVPATLDLVRRLGLQDQLQRADESAARRYLFRDGRLHLLPAGPISLLRSPVLSLRGRLRVFGEPLAPARPEGRDETVYEFAARRIGPEAASVLVDAMVSGVFAGDAQQLSLQSAFPKMAKMEAEHGGLLRAMVARVRARKSARREADERRARGEQVEALTRPGGPAGPTGTLTSFRDGLDILATALAREVGNSLRLEAPVSEIRHSDRRLDQAERAWTVRLASGQELEADAVVVAVPAPRAAPLLEGLDPELAATVGEIPTAGLAVVALGYREADLGGVDLDGFGFLVPRGTGPRILGCLWDSSLFPGRAPEGHVLLRCMIGGAHDPGAVSAEQDVLLDQVRRDVKATMGIDADPVLTRVYRWPLGIGQYTVGHQDRIDRIQKRLEQLLGLLVAGSSFYGISMNACLEQAPRHADSLIGKLRP